MRGTPARAAALAGLWACATTPAGPPLPPAERAVAEAQTLEKEERWEGAFRAYLRAIEIDPRHRDALRGWIEAGHRSGHLDEVEAALRARAARAGGAGDPLVEYGLGLMLFARGGAEAPRALDHLKRAAELQPGESDFHYRYGVALLEAERFADALPALARAVELDPGKARTRVALAVARARTGDRAGAMAELKAMLDRAPSPEDVRLGRKVAETLVDPYRDVPRVAREELETALAWMARADAPHQALEVFNRVLERFPDLGVVHALAGLCWSRLDEAGKAVSAYTRAAELSPLDPLPHLYLADLYLARDRPDQAREHYLAALERSPFASAAWRHVGDIALGRGDGKEAVRAYERLLVLEPDDADARVRLGRACQETGDAARAERLYGEALDRDPRSLDALMRLGLLFAERRLKAPDAAEKRRLGERAASYFERVLELQPENTAAQQGLAAVRE